MSKLKSKLVSPPLQIKQNRLWLLQEARIKATQALNISEALAKQKELICEKIKHSHDARCNKADTLIKVLTKSKGQPTLTDTWHEEVTTSLDQANKDNELSHIANSVKDSVTYQGMLDELESLQEQGKQYGPESDFYLDLMGCDWAHYIAAIHNDSTS